MTKRTRQTAQEAEDTVAVPTPARRSRRTAADNAEQQPEQPPQPQSERPIRTTRRSQQSQQDAAAIKPVESPSTRTSSRRQRQQEDNQQIQQQEELQQQLSQQPEIEQQQQHQLAPGQGQQAGNSPAHEAEAAGQLHAATANAASAAADAADAEAEDSPDEQVFDDFSKNGDLAQAVAALSNATADPAAFLQPSSDISQAARQAAKALLQYAITTASFARQQHEQQQEDQQQQQQQPDLQDHQQLYVDDGFDSEQIWYQLDMQLAPLRKRVKKLVGQIAEEGTQGLTSLIAPEFEAGLDAVLDEAAHGEFSGDDTDELNDDDDHNRDHDESDLDMDDDADDSAGSSEDEGQPPRKQGSRPSAKPKQQLLPVEDRFMRLDEMEAFVAQAEREEAGLEDEDDEGDDELGSDDDVDGTAGSRGAAGSDLGSDDDADLDDLLASSAALVGKKFSKQQKQRKATVSGDDDSDVEDLDGDEDDDDDGIDPGEIMYKDFFGDDGQPDHDADDSQDHDDHDDDGMDVDGDDGAAAAAAADKGSKGKGKAAAAAAGKKRVHWDDDEEDEDVDVDLGDHDGDVMSSDDDEEQQEEAPLSTHERRLLRMQERISQLEDEAMGEKPWHLVGEVSASRRPLNSALEIDMDYDTTNKPPPAPTEEATQSLEEVIKRRIAEARWDDVIRVLPPAPEVKKKQLDLDDTKAQQGLGEIYEAEYVQQATGFTAPDKAEPLRRQALALFKTLCGKLDALSSFAFTPKPVVEELEVRSDVAALAVEEVAPLAVSAADMRTPGEVFTAQAHGEQKAEAELTQEERKRRRARKKRMHKNKEAAKAAEAAARAAATGDASALAGRKSLAAQLAAATSSGLIKKGVPAAGAGSSGKSDFGKSSAVFGKLAEQAAGGVQGKKGAGGKEDKQQLKSAALKL